MLAYVFWHIPRPGVATREYEAAHGEFHDALWNAGIAGLLGLRVFRLAAIPWLGGKAGYEDWHLLADSSALDVLNGAAISQARQRPHDRIAALAADGTAGLYGIRQGSLNEMTDAHWLSKPAGMSYRDFESSLAREIDAGGCLWGRRMTLGPTPEFCLHPAPGQRPTGEHLSIALSSVLRYPEGRA